MTDHDLLHTWFGALILVLYLGAILLTSLLMISGAVEIACATFGLHHGLHRWVMFALFCSLAYVYIGV